MRNRIDMRKGIFSMKRRIWGKILMWTFLMSCRIFKKRKRIFLLQQENIFWRESDCDAIRQIEAGDMDPTVTTDITVNTSQTQFCNPHKWQGIISKETTFPKEFQFLILSFSIQSVKIVLKILKLKDK